MRGARSHAYKRHEISYKVTKAPKRKIYQVKVTVPLDRLFDTVKREKGKIDVLYASAGMGEAVPLGEITEQHFDATFGLNARGTLFTVQLVQDQRSGKTSADQLSVL